jgi:UDP-N-acetylmuramate--alanine ligase
MKTSIYRSKHIHCIGIGGSGLSALAQILYKMGAIITGSDIQESKTRQNMIKSGIPVKIGHTAANIPKNCSLVIYSPAIKQSNPEIREAVRRKLPLQTYPQALGELTKIYETIAICGTHGKTTTTALCAASFISAKKDPAVIVGSSVKELGGDNFRNGGGDNLIIEACEHFRSFMNYHPTYVIITNIEEDHLDFYKNLTNYKKAYCDFINKIPAKGLLVANIDDENTLSVIKKAKKVHTVYYGIGKDADYRIQNNLVFHGEKKIADLNLKIPGKHNLLNSAAVIALGTELGLNPDMMAKALNSYQGSARRFELKGIINNTHIIDDYAHHPTEIRATLKAVREKYGIESKVLVVFQPHQYSRTRLLLQGFAESFTDSNEVIIPNILRVRDEESDVKSISPQHLVKEISLFHKNVSYGNGLLNTAKQLKRNIHKYDVIITMGAGDVWKVADYLTVKSSSI